MIKKIITFFILILLLVGISKGVFALTNKQKGISLTKYNEKEIELIFENDLNITSLDTLGLFKSNNKISIYEDVLKNISSEKKELEIKNLKIAKNIYSLEFQLKSLGEDIAILEKETKKINANIVKTILEIKNKSKHIEDIKIKVEKNSDILREYIAYIYKKGNLFLDNGKLDNLKAILLSGENLGEVINDIYFKEILSVAGKRLINKHRKLMFDLYIEKKNLESETRSLKKLRKTFILKKKIFTDKKNFKKKILTISKGKESLYKKFIESKISLEKNLMKKSFEERVKIYKITKKVLVKEGCELVDVLKNGSDLKKISKKCYNLNKIIGFEAKLEVNKVKMKDKYKFNSLTWPISPTKGISAYFHDAGYKNLFNANHEAIDIRATQGTDIIAPRDGYVISVKKPTDNSYAYIALKHSDGLVTVYGHISESLVKKFDYVKAGEVFAKTGGTFGTLGAGYISTGPHLHFVVFKDKVHVDPLKYMDVSFLNFKSIPNKYKLDYFIDYKNRVGKEYSGKKNYKAGKIFKLIGANEVERQKNLLKKYARSDFNIWEVWVEEALRWNIDPTFMICIGLAESGLGRHLKTSYNVGNIGNVDSGGTWTMKNPREGIWWIGHTLNNKYLRKYNKISQLSGYGREGNSPIYASSPLNWHRNVTKCMSGIKQQNIPDYYNFRTN